MSKQEIREHFCPDCEETTEFHKIAGKWVCDCGYEFVDDEQEESDMDTQTEEFFALWILADSVIEPGWFNQLIKKTCR